MTNTKTYKTNKQMHEKHKTGSFLPKRGDHNARRNDETRGQRAREDRSTVPRRYFCLVPYCYLFLLSVFILWFTYYVSDIIMLKFRQLNDHLSGKELFIWFTARAFRKLRSFYVFVISLLDFRAGHGI